MGDFFRRYEVPARLQVRGGPMGFYRLIWRPDVGGDPAVFKAKLKQGKDGRRYFSDIHRNSTSFKDSFENFQTGRVDINTDGSLSSTFYKNGLGCGFDRLQPAAGNVEKSVEYKLDWLALQENFRSAPVSLAAAAKLPEPTWCYSAYKWVTAPLALKRGWVTESGALTSAKVTFLEPYMSAAWGAPPTNDALVAAADRLDACMARPDAGPYHDIVREVLKLLRNTRRAGYIDYVRQGRQLIEAKLDGVIAAFDELPATLQGYEAMWRLWAFRAKSAMYDREKEAIDEAFYRNSKRVAVAVLPDYLVGLEEHLGTEAMGSLKTLSKQPLRFAALPRRLRGVWLQPGPFALAASISRDRISISWESLLTDMPLEYRINTWAKLSGTYESDKVRLMAQVPELLTLPANFSTLPKLQKWYIEISRNWPELALQRDRPEGIDQAYKQVNGRVEAIMAAHKNDLITRIHSAANSEAIHAVYEEFFFKRSVARRGKTGEYLKKLAEARRDILNWFDRSVCADQPIRYLKDPKMEKVLGAFARKTGSLTSYQVCAAVAARYDQQSDTMQKLMDYCIKKKYKTDNQYVAMPMVATCIPVLIASNRNDGGDGDGLNYNRDEDGDYKALEVKLTGFEIERCGLGRNDGVCRLKNSVSATENTGMGVFNPLLKSKDFGWYSFKFDPNRGMLFGAEGPTLWAMNDDSNTWSAEFQQLATLEPIDTYDAGVAKAMIERDGGLTAELREYSLLAQAAIVQYVRAGNYGNAAELVALECSYARSVRTCFSEAGVISTVGMRRARSAGAKSPQDSFFKFIAKELPRYKFTPPTKP